MGIALFPFLGVAVGVSSWSNPSCWLLSLYACAMASTPLVSSIGGDKRRGRVVWLPCLYRAPFPFHSSRYTKYPLLSCVKTNSPWRCYTASSASAELVTNITLAHLEH